MGAGFAALLGARSGRDAHGRSAGVDKRGKPLASARRLLRGLVPVALCLALVLGFAESDHAQAQQVLPVIDLDTATEPMMLSLDRDRNFTVKLNKQPTDLVHVQITTQTKRSYRFLRGNEPIRFARVDGWSQPRMKSASRTTYDMEIERDMWNTGYTVGIVGRTRSARNSSGTLVFETALRPDTLIVKIDSNLDGVFDAQITHEIQVTHGRIEIPSCPYKYDGCLNVDEDGKTSYNLTLHQPPKPGETLTVTPSVDYQWPHHNFGPETRDGDVTFNPASVTWTRSDWLKPGGKTKTIIVNVPHDDDDNDEHFTIRHSFNGPFYDQRTRRYATGRKDDSIPAFDIVARMFDGGICGRTKAVRDEIVRMIGGGIHCRDVTDTHLAAISGDVHSNPLNLFNKGLSSLKAGDFDGLTNLKRLRMDRNSLTTLPAGIFDDLAGLMTLDLDRNQLPTLPAGIFDSLTNLRVLYLNDNRLAVLPDGVFKNNLALATHWMEGNPGAPFRPATNAGTDQTVATGEQVTLSGTAPGPWASSDTAWRWRQVDGPNSTTFVQGGVQRNGQTATFTAPAAPTVMHFRLAAIPKVLLEVRPNSSGGTSTTSRRRGILDGFAWVTITVEAGQGSPQQDAQAAQVETPACVSDALLADAQKAATETWRTSPGHVERWSRVLAAFGESNAYSNNPMTITEAQAQADRGLQRWAPVAPALQCLAAAPQEQPEPAEVQPATPGTPVTPELSLSAGSAVDEGGQATFTLTANPAPGSDLTVPYTVAQSGEYLDTPGAGHRTVVLTAGATSGALSVATLDDAADEADGSVSVTLGTGTGYTVATGQGSAAVTVRDNDEPVVSLSAGSGVTEGASASFTVSASPVPAAPLDITLSVGQSGDFAASGETGSRTVTIPVTGSATVKVATVDDSADEPDGSITATVEAGTGYTVAASPDHAATVAVSDNDAAASGPTISIADASFKENQRTGYFTVTLSEKVDWPVSVHYATRDSSPVSAVAGQDYLAWQRSWRLRARFRPGETETQIYVRLYNDSHDEEPETFEMVLFDADVNGPPGVSVSIADGVAVGTITNSDPMPAAWLARFGRTAAEQALDGIAGRIAASRDAGVQGMIAGQALGFDPRSPRPQAGPDGSVGAANGNAAPGSLSGNGRLVQSDVARGRFGDGGPGSAFGHDTHGFAFGSSGAQSYSMTAREALLGSSFTTTGEKDGMGGSVAFWGRAAQSSFDGREGTFSLDGEATTAMLGADYGRGNWLAGLALMRSSGDGGYADSGSGSGAGNGTDSVRCPQPLDAEARRVLCSGAVREGDGGVEASLTAAVPYAALRVSDRLKLWGAVGYGAGDVTLEPEVGGSLTSDISWTMAAAGLRGDVIAPPAEGSGPALAVTSDSLWARTSSDKTHELAASDSDVTRFRLGLEGNWKAALARGSHLTPKLELGMRQDGGDAETGFGVEVGGGLAWVNPTLGLSLDLSGRTLISHASDDLEDQGFAASLAWDPGPATARGPSLTLTQDWGGAAQGGLDALFRADPLEDRTGSGETAARWTAEAAYGYPAFSGRFTGSPHVGLGLATGARDYSVGWRLTPATHANAPDVSFGLKGTRRESDWTEPEHTMGFEATARW